MQGRFELFTNIPCDKNLVQEVKGDSGWTMIDKVAGMIRIVKIDELTWEIVMCYFSRTFAPVASDGIIS